MSSETQPFEDDIAWLIHKNKGVYEPPTEEAEEAFSEKVSYLWEIFKDNDVCRNQAYQMYVAGDLYKIDRPVKL